MKLISCFEIASDLYVKSRFVLINCMDLLRCKMWVIFKKMRRTVKKKTGLRN